MNNQDGNHHVSDGGNNIITEVDITVTIKDRQAGLSSDKSNN